MCLCLLRSSLSLLEIVCLGVHIVLCIIFSFFYFMAWNGPWYAFTQKRGGLEVYPHPVFYTPLNRPVYLLKCVDNHCKPLSLINTTIPELSKWEDQSPQLWHGIFILYLIVEMSVFGVLISLVRDKPHATGALLFRFIWFIWIVGATGFNVLLGFLITIFETTVDRWWGSSGFVSHLSKRDQAEILNNGFTNRYDCAVILLTLTSMRNVAMISFMFILFIKYCKKKPVPSELTNL